MGGKRKKSTNGPIKKESKYKIPSRFDCPTCDAKNSVTVKISRALKQGFVYCSACRARDPGIHPVSFEVRPLEKKVDVFFKFRELIMGLEERENQRLGLTHMISGNSAAASTQASPHGRSSVFTPAARIPTEDDDMAHFFAPVLDDEDGELDDAFD